MPAILLALPLLTGFLFGLLGVIALYRFPDVYTRIQGEFKCLTAGGIFVSAALLFHALVSFLADEGEEHFLPLFLHILVAGVLLAVLKNVGVHALARAVFRSGPSAGSSSAPEERRAS